LVLAVAAEGRQLSEVLAVVAVAALCTKHLTQLRLGLSQLLSVLAAPVEQEQEMARMVEHRQSTGFRLPVVAAAVMPTT
jgi:hypothetical protein